MRCASESCDVGGAVRIALLTDLICTVVADSRLVASLYALTKLSAWVLGMQQNCPYQNVGRTVAEFANC